MTLWGPCRKGYIPAERCPVCTPADDLRCTQGIGERVCRVLGPHLVHNDGKGMVWKVDMKLEVRKVEGIWKIWLVGWQDEPLLVGANTDWTTCLSLVQMFLRAKESEMAV